MAHLRVIKIDNAIENKDNWNVNKNQGEENLVF